VDFLFTLIPSSFSLQTFCASSTGRFIESDKQRVSYAILKKKKKCLPVSMLTRLSKEREDSFTLAV
jgi:activator of 2-hydroxyglutaryl-CoA dehydratase